MDMGKASLAGLDLYSRLSNDRPPLIPGCGVLPPSVSSWFVFMIGSWLGHTRWLV